MIKPTLYAHVTREFGGIIEVVYEIEFEKWNDGDNLECYINDICVVEYTNHRSGRILDHETIGPRLEALFLGRFESLYRSSTEFQTEVGAAMVHAAAADREHK